MLLTNAAGSPAQLLSPLLMFALVGGFFYFMIIRPQKKQSQEFKKTLESLKVGDKIVTRGGIKGEVVELKNDSFVIETAGSSRLELLKQSLSYIDSDPASNPHLTKTPVGNLDYGNDDRFINKLEELKTNNTTTEDYDMLLVDIFEYVVVEDAADFDSISSKFRLPEDRTEKIMGQLEDLGIISKDLLTAKREILIDPRQD
ncbi:preprotein translocase subunit YajC [uncultured Helcococcus sp.]|uniref:preprotein translocase subunit YajC n=1 Tax=uncultured Helcococcus sp. TaxID=1072508 RepID=UPI002629808A|nr:preprotein translocase subunit YajC [uncultured Helcococcus sp.]